MEARNLVSLEKNPKVQDFRPGDTVKVNVRIHEGDRVRTQAFQGVVIRQRAGGPSSSFTVRRIASGIGVERTFMVYSPTLESVDVVRRGKVRRAKLYYLRGLSGKESRIKERLSHGPKSGKGASGKPAIAKGTSPEATRE
ncbi:MAG: 50S ribosomal protein L19 [SAR202 cluster bacterium]|nr:50S ribosomal protein L19 [SAR202 cluster bacterium]